MNVPFNFRHASLLLASIIVLLLGGVVSARTVDKSVLFPAGPPGYHPSQPVGRASPVTSPGLIRSNQTFSATVYLPFVVKSGQTDEVFNPTSDTQLSGGNYTFASVNIPAGVTVTATGPLTFNVSGNTTIIGTLTSDCFAVEIRGQGSLILTGFIKNTCTTLPTNPPGVKLVVDGGAMIGSPAASTPAIVSDGSIFISDSATEHESLDPLPLMQNTAVWPTLTNPGQILLLLAVPFDINAPVVVGPGGDVSIFNDGPLNVNANQTGRAGLDAPAMVIGGTCTNNQRGGKGGSVRIGARNGTLTIAAGVTLQAGNGGKGGSCTAPTGCPATATAGVGGDGGSVLLGGQGLSFGAGVTLIRGNGGPGGEAIAKADDGAGPCADGCAATATAGKGGNAGGTGYIVVVPGVIAGAPLEGGANGGTGGVGTATGGHGRDCDKCPAGAGGNGGPATSKGGDGGNGGTGNVWPVVPGSHLKGNGGNVTATGGNGGKGANCCVKFNEMPGGNGGKGGLATANAGQPGLQGLGGNGTPGVAAGSGGNGGNGGDGLPPGAGGAKGGGVGTPNDIPDGVDGLPGLECPPWLIWFIYFSTIPDGVITPGSNIPLNTFAEDQTTQTGQVTVHFQTAQEFGSPVNYSKSGANVIVQSGGIQHNLSTILPGFPTVGVEFQILDQCGTPNCIRLTGYYQGQPVQTIGSQAGMGQELLRLPPLPPTVPYYDSFTITGNGSFQFDHWWVIIIDP